MTETERQQIVKELKVEGRAAGFTEDEVKKVRYTPHSGRSFYLWKQGNNVVYIKELSPTIGFYGTAYETMRRWADHEIRAFANQQLPGWEYHDGAEGERKPSKSGEAVWFNLKPTTNPNGSWYERRANVIAAAWKLYRELRDKGIFDKNFNPRNYEGPMNNESTIEALLKANLNVILTGAPGTGKTYTAKEVAKAMVGAKVSEDATDDEKKRAKEAEEERIASVQFHPGYDYSDFVVGMKPKIVDGKDGDKAVSFDWEDGVFKKFADKAKADLEHNYVFLIDEINRADLSRVFGELFSLLEEDYRYYKNEDGTEVNAKGITLPNGKNFVIPKNLYILGTMNDIDRSVESMDFALRRRFAWYEVKPDSEKDDVIIADKANKRKITMGDAKKLNGAMKALNKLIAPQQKTQGETSSTDQTKKEETPDLRLGSEYQLGGAIFAKLEKYVQKDENGNVKDASDKAFDSLWNNHIKNILSEYLRGRRDRDNLLLPSLEKAYKTAVGTTCQGDSTQDNQSKTPETQAEASSAQA